MVTDSGAGFWRNNKEEIGSGDDGMAWVKFRLVKKEEVMLH